MSDDNDIFSGLSVGELEALADCLLAPAAQGRLNELLIRQRDQRLSCEDGQELDRLFQRVDQLTILKTRARYTLQQQKLAPAQT